MKATFPMLMLIAAVILVTGPGNRAQGEETNKWPTLAEVRQKWDPIPLDKIKLAAGGGDLTAQHYLGYAFATGERGETNGVESVAWYERALHGGYLPSAVNLGMLYMKGQIVTQDLVKAVSYTRFAADHGVAQGEANLGFLYRDGDGVPKDDSEAVKWFRLAAGHGHTGGMIGLGRAYRYGNGVPKDTQEAIRWFQRAADLGDPLGTVNLGWMYGYENNAPQDEERAFKLFSQAAEKGQTDAMYELYLSYWDGKGVIPDHSTAKAWLDKAAEAGNPLAQCVLGDTLQYPRYPSGMNSSDIPTAVKWYRRSAEQDWAGGEYHLGMCYLAGNGVEWDEEKGLELIRKAADQNHSYSLKELAELYHKGIGEPRSESDRPVNLLKRVKKE